MKDFKEFEKYAEEHERECQVAAEMTLADLDYVSDGNVIDPSDLLNAAYSLNRSATLELLRQYHEWLAEKH